MKSILCNVAAILALSVLVGCPAEDDAKKTGTSGKAESKIVNTHCPIMGGEIDETLTVAYKDGKVAFCCDVCDPRWKALSDADKVAALESKGQGKEGKGHDHDKGHKDDHDKEKGHDHDKDKDKGHKGEEKKG